MVVSFLLLFDLLFILFRIALWPSAGKELSPWLFTCVVFILVPSWLYVSLSHLVFGAGCGIRLYRFLIIAFLYTLPYLKYVLHSYLTQYIICFIYLFADTPNASHSEYYTGVS